MEVGDEGSVAAAVYEGSRPLLIEIQALTARTNCGFPRRTCLGIDIRRLNMLLAVLERKADLDLSTQDVYVNVVGGLKPEGTATDLAVALAVYSVYKGRNPAGRTLAIGEIGLTGDLRSVRNAERMINEASRMGFDRVILPEKNRQLIKKIPEGLTLTGVKNIKEAIKVY